MPRSGHRTRSKRSCRGSTSAHRCSSTPEPVVSDILSRASRRVSQLLVLALWAGALGAIWVSVEWGRELQRTAPEVFLGAAPLVGRNFRDGVGLAIRVGTDRHRLVGCRARDRRGHRMVRSGAVAHRRRGLLALCRGVCRTAGTDRRCGRRAVRRGGRPRVSRQRARRAACWRPSCGRSSNGSTTTRCTCAGTHQGFSSC